MKINKDKYFKEGYLTNIKIFNKSYIKNIESEYFSFLKKNNSLVDRIEHKTKTHLYFPWANKIIFNNKILDTVEKILGPNFYCWNSLIFHKNPK